METLAERLRVALGTRYTVERELAPGGMARVFLGTDPVLEREVVIKVLPPELATAVTRERFEREAKLLAKLSHPHIVPILEAQHHEGMYWFVMPRIQGDSLDHRLTRGHLSPEDVRDIGLELLDALRYAHGQGVVHRDIKPGNVFLHDHHAFLADFGVAQLNDDLNPTLTADGQVIGTLGYMAPEQRQGLPATAQSDIYSLAATLYEAASGRRWDPLAGSTKSGWSGVPRWLAWPLRDALKVDLSRRFRDVDSFQSALKQGNWISTRRAVLAGLLLTLGIGAGAQWWGPSRPAPVLPPQRQLIILGFSDGGDSAWDAMARNANRSLEMFPRVSIVPWGSPARSQRSQLATLAHWVVTGSIAQHGSSDSIVVHVLAVEGDSSAGRSFQIRGKRADASIWGRRIADSIVAQLFPDRVTEFAQVRSTTNGGALKEYYHGQDLLQQQKWDLAEVAFRKSYELDTTFQPAAWATLLAVEWQRRSVEQELKLLLSHADELPPPIGALVRIQVERDIRVRIDGFKRIAAEFQYYGPARMLYANELFHRGPLVGELLQAGVDEWVAAAAAVPELANAATYDHTVWGAVRLGLGKLAHDDLSRRELVAPSPDDWGPLMALCVAGRFDPIRAQFRRWGFQLFFPKSDLRPILSTTRLGLEYDLPREQRLLGEVLVKDGSTNRIKATGEAAVATALLLQGQPLAALDRLTRGSALSPLDSGYALQLLEWPLFLKSFDVPIPAALLESARQELQRVPETDRLWPRATWALAVDANTRLDLTVVAQLGSALRRHAGSDPVARQLADFTTALLLGSRGAFDSALSISRDVGVQFDSTEIYRQGPFARAVVKYHRGEWNRQLGRWLEAEREWRWHENNDFIGWPLGEPQQGELDAALSAVARLRRAENLCKKLDDRDAAKILLDRVLELWSDADSLFAPMKKQARDLRIECQ